MVRVRIRVRVRVMVRVRARVRVRVRVGRQGYRVRGSAVHPSTSTSSWPPKHVG